MVDPQEFYSSLQKNDINFFSGVPDSLLKDICAYISDNSTEDNHKITANEGSAIGLSIGYFLATNKLPFVYMQNSGIGNAINPLISLADKLVYSIPILLMIGWRGEPGVKDEPQHIKQGIITEKLLDVLSIPYEIIKGENNQKEINNIIKKLKSKALKENTPVALLVKKGTFKKYAPKKNPELLKESFLSRTDVLDHYVGLKKDNIVISTTGVTSRELLAVRKKYNSNCEKDFLTVGGMGHANQIALGIALYKKNTKVICFDGDGSLLMHMGSLASIIDSKCKNYIYILLNNFVHDSVGAQPIGAKSIDFIKVAEACGFKKKYKINNKIELRNLEKILNEDGPIFIEFIIRPGFPSDLIRPDKSPKENKYIFQNALSI